MILALITAAVAASTQVTGSLSIQVSDRDKAVQTVIAAAKADGGWFSSLSDSAVTVRVPVDKARPFVDAAQRLGRVTDRSWNAQALDSRLTDLHARLSARQDVLERYLAVLADAHTDAMVTVQSEVSRTLTEIEQIEGQIRYLEHQAAWAQLTVSFQFQDRAAPRKDGGSSFAWLNTMDLADLQWAFRNGRFSHHSASVSAAAPTGFAAWKKTSRFAASSADDVVYRVRTEKNKPFADLAFWTEALRTRQRDAGYTALAEGTTNAASGQPGAWIELGAANGTRDDVYLVAVFVDDKRLVVVEAAGEAGVFTTHRDAVLAALAKLSF